MTELAGALERVAGLYEKGPMSEGEFTLAKAGILAAPAGSNSGGAAEACLVELTGIAKHLVRGEPCSAPSQSSKGKDGGWARGTVKSLARTGPNAGLYGVKFVSEQLIRFLELREEDYDTDDIWVQIKKAG